MGIFMIVYNVVAAAEVLKQLFTGKETCSLHPLTNGLFKVRAKVACPSKYNFSIISLLINILAQGYRGGGR